MTVMYSNMCRNVQSKTDQFRSIIFLSYAGLACKLSHCYQTCIWLQNNFLSQILGSTNCKKSSSLKDLYSSCTVLHMQQMNEFEWKLQSFSFFFNSSSNMWFIDRNIAEPCALERCLHIDNKITVKCVSSLWCFYRCRP